jgi:hypothetical protein
VGPRAGLNAVKKFLTVPGLELRPLGRPARSQSLYRLRYPGSYYAVMLLFYYKSTKGHNITALNIEDYSKY